MTSQIQFAIEDRKLRSKRKTIKIKKGAIQRFPFKIMREYNRELQKMVSELISQTRANVYPALPFIVAEAEAGRPVQDSNMDDYSDQILRVVDTTRLGFEQQYPDIVLQNIATDVAFATSQFNKIQLQKVFKQMAGVDVFFNDAFIQQELQAFIKSNVDLIKTVPERYFNDIEGIMFRGTQAGLRHEVIRSQIISRYPVTRNNAKRIARDQVNKLNGQLTQLRQQEIGVKGYTWITVGDERVRPTHENRDGKMFKWSNPPPDGHPGFPIQCFPSESKFISPVFVDKLYRRSFNGKLTKLITSSGKVITCTPNHPMFNGNDFIAADKFNIGDNLINVEFKGGCIFEKYPEHKIPSFQEVFSLLKIVIPPFKCTSSRFSDFHGDSVIDQEVDIISIKSILMDDIKTNSAKGCLQDIFATANMSLSFLPGRRYIQECFLCLGLPSTSSIRFFSNIFSFLDGSISESDDICLRAISYFNSKPFKTLTYGTPIHPIFFREGQDAVSFEVLSSNEFRRDLFSVICSSLMMDDRESLLSNLLGKTVGIDRKFSSDLTQAHPVFHHIDTIVDKGIIEYSGHVFNLETANNEYIIPGGYISANCRCWAQPKLEEFL